MKKGVILVDTDDKEILEWYENGKKEFDFGFDIVPVKYCYSVPDKMHKGRYICRLPNGKIVLPNRKYAIAFEKDSEYLVLDYVEKPNCVIANRVIRLPDKIEQDDIKVVLWIENDRLYYIKVIELDKGIYYRLRTTFVDLILWKEVFRREIINLDIIRDILPDYLIRIIFSHVSADRVLKILKLLGYDWDIETFSEYVKNKYPGIYYEGVREYLIKQRIEKEVIEKYGIETIKDLVGYYKIRDFSNWGKYDSLQNILETFYREYDGNYDCNEWRPVFKEIIDKINEILSDYPVPDDYKR